MLQARLGDLLGPHTCNEHFIQPWAFKSGQRAQPIRQVVVRAEQAPTRLKQGKSLDLGGSAREDETLQQGPPRPSGPPQRPAGGQQRPSQRPNQGPQRPRQNQGQQRPNQGGQNRPPRRPSDQTNPFGQRPRQFQRQERPERGPPPQRQEQHGRQGRSNPDDPLMNSDIGCKEVRVLNSRKEQLGVMQTFEAQALAEAEDVDMILINPDAEPPLVRLIPLDKLNYEHAKQEKDQRKKQRESRQDLKEMRFRPNTEEHDYNTRLRNARKHLSKGDKVKLTMRFKGREREFKNLGEEMFERFVDDIGDEAQVSERSRFQGNQMSIVLAPVKK